MRESNFWLRITDATVDLNEAQRKEVKDLIAESKELSLILASILNKTQWAQITWLLPARTNVRSDGALDSWLFLSLNPEWKDLYDTL